MEGSKTKTKTNDLLWQETTFASEEVLIILQNSDTPNKKYVTVNLSIKISRR